MQNDSWERELSSKLQDSERQLDPATTTALAAARKRALESAAENPRKPGPQQWQGWLLVASVALIAVLVALPSKREPTQSLPAVTVMALEEGPHEDPDLFENLEFYEWLAAQEDLG